MHLITFLLVGVRAPQPDSTLFYGDLVAAGLIIFMLLIIKYSSSNAKNKNYV